MKQAQYIAITVGLLLTTAVAKPWAADYPVAGLNPSQRPDGAPVVTAVAHPGEWYTRALRGVSPPYPYSLRFLEDQGGWYTPFTRPGMTGRYDIRGWHLK